MQSLRTLTELVLQHHFDQQACHGFVLAQGLLPADILKDPVINEFVPSERGRDLSQSTAWSRAKSR